MDNRDKIKLSKFLAKVLRHQPGLIGIQLDREGWCDLQELVEKINHRGWKGGKIPITIDDIREVVAFGDKKRYFINGDKIRASQGHTAKEVDLQFEQIEPPEYLYHGTARKVLPLIQEQGLLPMKRHYVHLSPDIQTAMQVGRRKDAKPVILRILAHKAQQAGIPFYLAENQVYLVKELPFAYIEEIDGKLP